MPTLWIAMPFTKDECDGTIAHEVSFLVSQSTVFVPKEESIALPGGFPLENYALTRYGLPGGSYALQAGRYGLKGCSFSGGDVLVLVAHGKANSGDLFSARDCKGTPMPMKTCFERLEAAGASSLSKIFFAVPFSARPGHSAVAYDFRMNGCPQVWGCSGMLGTKSFVPNSAFNAVATAAPGSGILQMYSGFTKMTGGGLNFDSWKKVGDSTLAQSGKRTLVRI